MNEIIVAITYNATAWEFSLDTWPAVPRKGDTVTFIDDEGHRIDATIDDVVWDLNRDAVWMAGRGVHQEDLCAACDAA